MTKDLPAEANVGEAWTDESGRLRQPQFMRVDGDGTVTYGMEAIAATVRHDVRRHRAPRRPPMTTLTPPRRTARPRERRAQSSRSSARSGDSGDDGEPPAPPAAIEAVAYAWMDTLRRRHPEMAWDVEGQR